MVFRQGFVVLLLCTVVSSFSWLWESAETLEEIKEKRSVGKCKNHMDCFKCDEIKRKHQCQEYMSVCAKTCNPDCAMTPFVNDPHQPCEDVKKRGDCMKTMPYSSSVWATACEKSCCVLDKPPQWGPWSEWGPCSKSCHFGYKTRTRKCEGEGFDKTCEGPSFESDKLCNVDAPCKGLVGWEKTAVTVGEDVDTITIKITRSRLINRVANITVNTQDDTATQPDDYAKIENLVISFAKFETEKSVTFTIKKDNLIESLESFNATISGNPHKLDIDPEKTTIFIKDHSAKIGFRPDSYDVKENLKMVSITVYREGFLLGTNKLCISTVDGTAKTPGDYVAISKQEVVFAPNEQSKQVSITIVDDGVEEKDEKFFVQLGCADPFVYIQPGKATVVILNDDVDGNWSEWSPYGECSKTCGGGSQSRSRTCTNPKPQGGGKGCEGEATSTRKCNTNPCPVDGGYGEYGPYGECSKSCGGGEQSRTRECNNPPPQHGGKPCEGPSKESRACNTDVMCPVDGGYGEYGPYGECSKSCGGGEQLRTRECNNPAPQYGGKPCEGPSKESQACNTNPCPVDGQYSEWSNWSEASRTCGGATKYRVRTCTNPAPQHGGKPCEGKAKETRTCNSKPCPAHIGVRPIRRTVLENIGKFHVLVFRIGNSIGTNKAQISTIPGTAEAGKDYAEIPPTQIIFKPGESLKKVEITIVNDKILEKPETFQLNLKSDDPGVTEVRPDTSTITIVDDDVKIGFLSVKYEVIESRTFVTLKLYRAGNTRMMSRVILNTIDGTAKANSDYRPLVNFPVTFRAGQTLHLFRVQIFDNRIVENLERFTVQITSSESDDAQIYPGLATVDIIDDDAIIGFEHIKYQVDESSGILKVLLKRSGATRFQHTAILASRDGTAAAPRDYQRIRPTLIRFAPNEVEKEISIKTIDDKIEEGLETFQLLLASRDPRATVKPNAATVFIKDNDIDGRWSDWSSWSACGKTCGMSTKSRSRICHPPEGGGRPCFGQAKQTRRCFIRRYCPVDGGFTSWSSWSRCSKSCGGGRSFRRRTCTNPAARYGGARCRGPRRQIKICNDRCCPGNGRWSRWSAWSRCSRTCRDRSGQYGITVRTRTCSNPPPSCGGRFCFGGSAAGRQVRKCRSRIRCSSAKTPPNTHRGSKSHSAAQPSHAYQGIKQPDHSSNPEGERSGLSPQPSHPHGGMSQPDRSSNPEGEQSGLSPQSSHPHGGMSQPDRSSNPEGEQSGLSPQSSHPHGGMSQPDRSPGPNKEKQSAYAYQSHPYGSNDESV